MKLYIASDHAGIKTKQDIIKHLEKKQMQFVDLSKSNKDTDDYPDYAKKVSKAIQENKAQGILVCGTGIGMSIAANKHKGIRAALCATPNDAELSRAHNDANVLVMSSKTSKQNIGLMINKFLETKFEKGRHQRRVNKIKKLEN